MTLEEEKKYPFNVKRAGEVNTIELKPEQAFVVDYFIPDNSPGLYGWRSKSKAFLTEAEAMEVAKLPMGIAMNVQVRHIVWKPDLGGKVIYKRDNAAFKAAIVSRLNNRRKENVSNKS